MHNKKKVEGFTTLNCFLLLCNSHVCINHSKREPISLPNQVEWNMLNGHWWQMSKIVLLLDSRSTEINQFQHWSFKLKFELSSSSTYAQAPIFHAPLTQVSILNIKMRWRRQCRYYTLTDFQLYPLSEFHPFGSSFCSTVLWSFMLFEDL